MELGVDQGNGAPEPLILSQAGDILGLNFLVLQLIDPSLKLLKPIVKLGQ